MNDKIKELTDLWEKSSSDKFEELFEQPIYISYDMAKGKDKTVIIFHGLNGMSKSFQFREKYKYLRISGYKFGIKYLFPFIYSIIIYLLTFIITSLCLILI